jgi:hypothetical protein
MVQSSKKPAKTGPHFSQPVRKPRIDARLLAIGLLERNGLREKCRAKPRKVARFAAQAPGRLPSAGNRDSTWMSSTPKFGSANYRKESEYIFRDAGNNRFSMKRRLVNH